MQDDEVHAPDRGHGDDEGDGAGGHHGHGDGGNGEERVDIPTDTRKLGCMIDVRRLRVLREVAEQGTLAAAAEVLHLTPSAVSQQLAALEREVGQPVVERNGRGVRLTGAAEVLIGHADVVLAQLEAAEADVAAYAGGAAGTVRVAGFATALAELVAGAARALAGSHPALKLVVVEQEAPECFGALARGDIDVAISMSARHAPAADDRRFRRRPLMSDELDAVLPAGHRLAHEPVVPLAALRDDPFVGPPEGTQCHDVVITGCTAAGFSPAIAHRTVDFHTAMALVAAGLGVSLIPRLAQTVVPPGAVIRPLAAPAPARHVFAASRAGAERRPGVAALLDALAAAGAPSP